MATAEGRPDLKIIDGGVLEGGGQILRMAVAFSALLKKPIRIHNIRAGREKGGLRAQHLSGINLVRDICGGKLSGGQMGSTEIELVPGDVDGGYFKAETETAGSAVLLMQIAFPCVLFAKNKSTLQLGGGTDADFAPSIDFTRMVFKKHVEKFGVKFELHLVSRGFFPKGGGLFRVEAEPLASLTPIDMTDRGDVVRIVGSAFTSGGCPPFVSNAMADAAERGIRRAGYGSVHVAIDRVADPKNSSVGSGNGIILIAETTTGCLISGNSLGKRGVEARMVGEAAAKMLIHNLNHGGCVDDHMQDQLIIFMALADGVSKVRCGPTTLHTKTAIHIASLMTEAKFKVYEDDPHAKNCIIECIGHGYKIKN